MINIWKPEVFQGAGKKKNYFEGWYFKSVDRAEKTAYVIIPGISLGRSAEASHAFVIFIDARNSRMEYFKYPLSGFRPEKGRFGIHIGPNYFSRDRLTLNLGEGRIVADLVFENIDPWPVRLLSPGVMGWYAFVPGMECYHGVLSFDHDIRGSLTIDGNTTDFTGGKGYCEKDWGVSMPSAWIWMQTNHFEEDGVSLSGSIAKIPWLGHAFTGYIFGLFYKGELYAFTTYAGTRVSRLDVTDKNVEISLVNKRYRLDITAARAGGVDIPAPSLGEMTSKVNETLNSMIAVSLFRKEGAIWETVFSGVGRNAGLELAGDVKELIKGLKQV